MNPCIGSSIFFAHAQFSSSACEVRRLTRILVSLPSEEAHDFFKTNFFCFHFIEPFDVNFPQYSDSYAITDDIPDMTSFSFCFWVKLDHDPVGFNKMTFLSYTNSKFQKAYLLDTYGGEISIYMDDENV